MIKMSIRTHLSYIKILEEKKEMRKVKWGVVGAGGIADRRTIPGMMLANNAELVAVMEINMELAEKLRAKYNAKYAYDNAMDLINNPEVEAVYIASPVLNHVEPAIACARAGKHLLCEKPIAISTDLGYQVIEECKKAGIKAATGFMMRYGAYHMAMKKLIEEGKLGQIVTARAQFTCWYPEIPGAWRQDKKQSGGGALMDLGVHCIDLLEYITGAKAESVSAFVDTKTFKYNVDDTANLMIRFSNGMTGYVDNNFNIPDAAAKCRLEFYGTRGSIMAESTMGQIDGGKVEVVISEETEYDALQSKNEVAPLKLEVEFGNMYTREIESFSDSIINGTPINVPIEDAVHVQEVVDAACRSSESGKVEKIK